MDFHTEALQALCRTCGERICVSKPHSDKLLFVKEIDLLFDFNIWKDDSEICPSSVCHKCLRKLQHCRKGTRVYHPNPDLNIVWTKHSRTGICSTCNKYKKSQLGSRGVLRKLSINKTTLGPPRQPEQPQLPFDLESSDIFSHLHSIFSIRQPSNYKLELTNSTPSYHQSFFTCPICLCVLSNPIYSQCQHSFCSDCLTQLFKFNADTSVPCPICNNNISYRLVQPCPRFLHVQLESVTVFCSNCKLEGQLSSTRDHVCPTIICVSPSSSQHVNPIPTNSSDFVSPVTAAAATLAELANQHTVGQPVPQKIADMTDKWTWFRLKASRDKAIKLHTRGIVSVFSFRLS